MTAGEPFDFGTHANDFLVSRENTLATETFLVRVPGVGAVPEHVHTDMEQTFVFLSGVGRATLTNGDEVRSFHCVPGDTVFVPTGWHHTVRSESLEGMTYLTVNAFVPGAQRVGGTALEHAKEVNVNFAKHRSRLTHEDVDSVSAFRTAETTFHVDTTRAWPQDYTAMQTTLSSTPGVYRVERLGPFEYAIDVTAAEPVLTPELADRIIDHTRGLAPVYVEGSQSPLSVKPPYAGSDLDLLVVIQDRDELPLARKTVLALKGLADELPVPLAVGVVHDGWLKLPSFYSALDLHPIAIDRRWWFATGAAKRQEAARRLQAGLEFIGDHEQITALFHQTIGVAGRSPAGVREWRITPRWRGYDVLEML
ncbi:cupin domain-containing protein [Rhizocola hellebori]|uniref:cupin domain-containing protein n=1 Tax=Rhizocola hellebori TaxID=1392758 RepID=UPI001EF296C2|nr:cupin domain-containing protein [Rhizocola hellebori]